MANIHAILAIAGSALAALTVLIIVGAGVLLPALFAIGAGIYVAVALRDDRLAMIGGAVAVIAGLLATLGALGGATFGENGAGPDFAALTAIAGAFAVLGCLAIVASLLPSLWDSLPQAGAIGAAVALVAAVVLAFVFSGQLGSQADVGPWIIAVLALVGLYPAIVAVRA